ncbi:MAG: branched-chain amino acid aminotransferase [Acholeplasmataceae bacterium]
MSLGFKYNGTKKAFISHFSEGKWDEGYLTDNINIDISLLASALQYGQSAFEGLKAYRSKDNKILLFRPNENHKRFNRSLKRLVMPEMDYKKFINAIKLVVKENEELIPSFESKGALYIRPFVFGTESVLGVRPSNTYLFGIVASPVGSYFNNGFNTIKLMTSDYDRAAPNGLGSIKAGANYASSLYPKQIALESGFNDCLYLDPKTHTKLDETGATNIIGITNNNEFITPNSNTVLPSITNMSLQEIASDLLNLKVIKRDINLTELKNFKELGACGTAAILTPISLVQDKDIKYRFESSEILHKLYDLLQSIQFGLIKFKNDWVIEV